ncbi:hypothetical protein THAOC_32385 [Thalassiosira oceanica]|uniref:Uncharacterized protein n=1 Tax=Thalassiosira oceanica TaxID=159749 RepID=K0R652_THAOC|nr:hypothetical protein THAOC_32385 [Thalassiosira oceanica]|eukprot:EJK48788.1 hypothetical protein THAOC_32385 [Thalassiosira oceanica]
MARPITDELTRCRVSTNLRSNVMFDQACDHLLKARSAIGMARSITDEWTRAEFRPSYGRISRADQPAGNCRTRQPEVPRNVLVYQGGATAKRQQARPACAAPSGLTGVVSGWPRGLIYGEADLVLCAVLNSKPDRASYPPADAF